MSDKALIFKICSTEEWDEACQKGVYTGSADDLRDGFIHFSASEQLQATYEKYFADQSDLVIVSVDTAKLDFDALKWEISRNGEKFPHLYGDLNLDAVVKVEEIPDP